MVAVLEMTTSSNNELNGIEKFAECHTMSRSMRSTNLFSHMLTLSEGDPARVTFEREIWLLGRYWECRYYLSVATDVDQFIVPDSRFFDNLRAFVTLRTSDKAYVFFQNGNASDTEFYHSILRAAYEERRGISASRKGKKQRRAIETLLRHPTWSDADIVNSVGTTEKQLQRNVDFVALRRIQRRQQPSREREPHQVD